ncbi:hypothetical protein L3V83_07150 [Thiotrichales bacterium 19X7-9]|nr:hypothetical protein [Thiotrichales bacterium 19X7-9]
MNFQFNYFITMFLLVIGLPNFISAHENTTTCNNNWIKALIAETQPPDNIQQYANDIYQLAPNVERINLRVTLAGITTIEAYNQLVKKYQNLIKALYSVYGNHTISIGFHPDNSKSSAKYHIWWNPDNGNPNTQNCISWQCVMSNSIILMNKINAVFPSGKGFTEFSIEQSYLEPQDINDLRAEKSCLNGNAASLCPTGITLAEPAVSYGYVGPSYGDVSRYGPNDLDYGYPQYYNKYPRGKQRGIKRVAIALHPVLTLDS